MIPAAPVRAPTLANRACSSVADAAPVAISPRSIVLSDEADMRVVVDPRHPADVVEVDQRLTVVSGHFFPDRHSCLIFCTSQPLPPFATMNWTLSSRRAAERAVMRRSAADARMRRDGAGRNAPRRRLHRQA